MRRAFVMGSNGSSQFEPLSYAVKDAENIASALSSPLCNYEVVQPASGTPPLMIYDELMKIAESCRPGDTLLCYFAGHGMLDVRGNLFLVWDQTDRESLMRTAIPIFWISEALKHSRASHKLLILDCCHAGAAVGMRGGTVPLQELGVASESHAALVASRKLERTRELHDIEGGFMTQAILKALGDKFHEADRDGDGNLSIDELRSWLFKATDEHNRKFPSLEVPAPYLIGEVRGDFFVTATSTWEPYEIDWVDDSTMVILPILPVDGYAWCISKYPVTNQQYQRFVKQTKHSKPSGKYFDLDQRLWRGPFIPWDSEQFDSPSKPVVCVSYYDALQYCSWVNEIDTNTQRFTLLPTTQLWDIAAFDTVFYSKDPSTWLTQTAVIHHNSPYPAPISDSYQRQNGRGVVDMIGNIWEWCVAEVTDTGSAFPRNALKVAHSSFASSNEPLSLLIERRQLGAQSTNPRQGAMISIGGNVAANVAANVTIDNIVAGPQPRREIRLHCELRGGSFLDNLETIEPFISVHKVDEDLQTKHSDLGFRIAGAIHVNKLPEEIQQRMANLKPKHGRTATSFYTWYKNTLQVYWAHLHDYPINVD